MRRSTNTENALNISYWSICSTHVQTHLYICSVLTVKTDLDPEFSKLRQEVLKYLSVSSRQFRGQHNAHVRPWRLCQGVREHVDPRVSQQHWSVCCQWVQPVTHLENTKTHKNEEGEYLWRPLAEGQIFELDREAGHDDFCLVLNCFYEGQVIKCELKIICYDIFQGHI